MRVASDKEESPWLCSQVKSPSSNSSKKLDHKFLWFGR